jgi:hypothetical protein
MAAQQDGPSEMFPNRAGTVPDDTYIQYSTMVLGENLKKKNNF